MRSSLGLATRKAPGGQRPFCVAFSPGGHRIAVGYVDSTRVDVLSGDNLGFLNVVGLHTLASGGLVFGSSDPAWEILDVSCELPARGAVKGEFRRPHHVPSKADLRGLLDAFRIDRRGKRVLEALGGKADRDGNGAVNSTELENYLYETGRKLTDEAQTPVAAKGGIPVLDVVPRR